MRGRILRAETVHEPGAGPGLSGRALTRVSLLTDTGLRQFVLEDSEAVQVVDPALRERIGQAVVATQREVGRDTRRMTISSVGTGGPRTVRASYVAVAPLWKASYRLVLPSDQTGLAGQQQARLQGWATLENDTGTDWSGISLAVQYGNPVTFHQAIYRSYFVQRPEVPVEVLGRLLPDVDIRSRAVPALAGAPAPPPAPAPAMAPMMRRMTAEPPPEASPNMSEADTAAVQEAASQTVFTLTQKLDLPAGHSATVPILDVTLPAARVGLATPGQEHPLDSIRIENTTGSSLPAGVLTLYDLQAAAPYAGDARLGGVPTGQNRLISYAQDLRTSITWRDENAVSVASLTAADGVLTVDERTRQLTHATISAPADASRRILIDVTKLDGAVVASGFAAPAEETATSWRFAVDLDAGAVREVTYAIDQHETRTIALLDDDDAVSAVMTLPGASPAAQAALQRVTKLRATEAATRTAREQLATQKAALDADEERLRENLKALQPGDSLRARLLRQLDDDETKQGELSKAIDAADRAVTQAHRALTDAVAGLRL